MHRTTTASSKRRTITGGLAALVLGAAVVAPPAAAAPPAAGLNRFTEQLPVPPVLDLTAGGTASLTATRGSHVFHSDLPPTPTFGYALGDTAPTDVYLGPTLEVRRGAPVQLSVTNGLAGPHPLASVIDTTLEGVSELDAVAPRIATHLHGGHTPPDSDGGPDDTFRPAGTALPPGELDFAGGTGTVTYDYPNDQEAATLWYHDHAVGITRLNVMAGLAGMYFVRDGIDTGRPGNALGLPTGAREVPLVLQDRMFAPDGRLAYPTGPFFGAEPCPAPGTDLPCEWLPEFFGDVATVNGKAWPNHTVDQAVHRFRVVNGSNARVYDLKLQNASGTTATAPVWQIGTDGGLLDAPVRMTRLLLAPGERADLLVDFRPVPAGTRLVLANTATTPFPSGPRATARGGSPLKQIIQFTVGGPAAAPGAVPAVLRPGAAGLPAPVPGLQPQRTRTVALTEVMNEQYMAPQTALLNGIMYSDALADPSLRERPQLNTVEEWVIVNTTADTHPIHLHLTQFQVKDRQRIDAAAYLAAWGGTGPRPDPGPFLRGGARAPSAAEQGWKDSVQANPGEVVRILVPFGGTAAGVPSPFTGDPVGAAQRFIGQYVWHCHILEHEDNDMMLPYDVVA